MKSQIVEQLGQTGHPVAVPHRGAVCGEYRVKARLSVLAAAARRARDPNGDASFDSVRRSAVLPALITMAAGIRWSIGRAPAPVRAGSARSRCLERAIWDRRRHHDPSGRSRAIRPRAPRCADNFVRSSRRLAGLLRHASHFAEIARLTGTSSADDPPTACIAWSWTCTRRLNRLPPTKQRSCWPAPSVYGLRPETGPRSKLSWRHRATRRLKFDHPGLATTATRSGARLTIQNDIGETGAHVVVIAS